MGLTLEFLVGNDKAIIKASKKDIDLFEKPGCIIKKADFSLHLAPKDLNTLSVAASKFNSLKSITFREYLILIVDEIDHGLFRVADQWIKYFSEVPANNLDQLVEEWFELMKREYPKETIELTPEALGAVKNLYELCKYALSERKSVFHFWLG